MSPLQGPCADYQIGFENQPIVPGKLTLVENNLLADEKGNWKREADNYLHIYLTIDLLIKWFVTIQISYCF